MVALEALGWKNTREPIVMLDALPALATANRVRAPTVIEMAFLFGPMIDELILLGY